MLEGIAERGGETSLLTGSMIELHWDCVFDLLASRKEEQCCYVGDDHLVRGCTQVTVRSRADAVGLAAAVERRSTSATLMNDSSSRAHCVTTLLLTTRYHDSNTVRQRRFQFFDMMGSERFKGPNASMDERKNNKKAVTGMEGIVGNMSLSHFTQCVATVVERTERARRRGRSSTVLKRKSSKSRKRVTPASLHHVHSASWCPFKQMNFTRLIHGSFHGTSLTAMVITLSQSIRNGYESYHSLRYGSGVHKLRTRPRKTPLVDYDALLASVERDYAANACAAHRVSASSKYAAKRAQEARFSADLHAQLAAVGPAEDASH